MQDAELVSAFWFEAGTTQTMGGASRKAVANRAAVLRGGAHLGAGPANSGRLGAWPARTATGAMSAPPALQIREANAHLAAVHRRAAELEARLDAAERTVRAQAERLARHDRQLLTALDELRQAKDR